MRQPVSAMILVALVTLATYVVAVRLVDLLPGVDVVMPLALWWTGAWTLGLVFASWNLWDAALDARAAYSGHRPARVRAGGLWRLRSDCLQFGACLAMVTAGALAIVQWTSADVRTALILAGGVAVIMNQAWNRVDRERVMRMLPQVSETRAMERLAAEIAASARRLGHDIANAINGPIGTLELLRVRPGTTPEEAAEIGEAIDTLVALAAHVRELHQAIRQRDPSLLHAPRSTSEAP